MPTFLPRIPLTAIVLSLTPLPHSAVCCDRGLRRGSFVFLELSALLVFLPERLDLHVHTRRKLELHERVHGLLRRLENVEQALMSANLKLLTRLLVHVRRTQHAVFVLHRGQRNRSRNLCPRALRRVHNFAGGLVKNAIVVCFQPDADSFFANHVVISQGSCSRLIARRSLPRFRKKVRHSRTQESYAIISVMVPAPTVRPPSRMANRKPFSMATGVISSISSATLSPGITISVPAGKVATPVTSVVRK